MLNIVPEISEAGGFAAKLCVEVDKDGLKVGTLVVKSWKRRGEDYE